MSNMERKNLFDRFKVSLFDCEAYSTLLEQYNLIGTDFGDGEVAACQALWNPISSEIETKQLTFQGYVVRYHVPNILYSPRGNQLMELMPADRLSGDAYIAERTFSNFKTVCDGMHEQLHYNNDQKLPTYADLMSHSLACIVKCLFDNNSKLDRKKPTIIMVGMPSSKRWARYEHNYATVLSRKFGDYLPGQEVHLVVIPESIAAMAGEIGMDQASWQKGIKQIFDGGSSTFDLTTVSPAGTLLEGQDSYQFGGNQLDELLVEFGDYLFKQDCSGCSMVPEMGKKAKLRLKKELVYGDGGKNLEYGTESYLYRKCGKSGRELKNSLGQTQTYTYTIDKTLMGIVLNNPEKLSCLSTNLCHQGGGFRGEAEPQDSWLAACGTVLKRFHEKTKELCPEGRPDLLILTGGVSNMPEVCKLAEKIFRPKSITLSKDPSTSVSKGLALVLANEIKKWWLLQGLDQELDAIFPPMDTLLDTAAREACAVSLNCYDNTIREWASGAGKKTLTACLDALSSKQNQYFDDSAFSIAKVAEKWYRDNRIAVKVQEAINEKFKGMFPNIDKCFVLPEMVFEDVKYDLGAEPKVSIAFFFDSENEPDEEDILNKIYSSEERNQIYQVFQKHRRILENGGMVPYRNWEDRKEPGLYLHYQQKFEDRNVQAVMNEIYDSMKAHCKNAVGDFVEDLTYYFTSARFANGGGN